MSMYTEIYVKALLKEDVDDNVINILKYMLGKENMMCYWANFKDYYEEGLWAYLMKNTKI